MLCSVVPQFTGANDDTGWSLPVNDLEARLSFGKKETINGTPLISTYLELRNVADIANVMELPLNLDRIQFEVVDERDKTLPQAARAYDEVSVEVGMLRMPYVSYLRLNIPTGALGYRKTSALSWTSEFRMSGCSAVAINARIICFQADDTGRNVTGANGISMYYASLWPTLI